MIEHRPGLRITCHATLAIGVATVPFSLWIAFAAPRPVQTGRCPRDAAMNERSRR
jgi:hypothetical protein